MTATLPPRPDRVLIWRDAAGEWRWTRRNGYNDEITAVSGEGYTSVTHAVEMAFAVNGGTFEVVSGDGQVIDRPHTV